MTDYAMMTAQLTALSEGVDSPLTDLANASALLWDSLEQINWAGFYFLRSCPRLSGAAVAAKAGAPDELLLGAFQGKPACVRIPLGRGVCGTAAALDRTQLVPDVHAFPGHIACDSASRSEIVIPLHAAPRRVIGVLDIDSPIPARFSEEDRIGLEAFAQELERILAPLLD